MNERPRIDLYSDTQTRPSQGMREAIASAEVGDEQRNEDPTVRELCSMTAELLGKDAALFLPSGTMCNEIAYRTHTRPGEEIILHETSHALHFEGGAPAALSGVMLRPLPGDRGMFTADQVRAAVRGRQPPFSALAPGVGREHHQSGWRGGVERGGNSRSRRGCSRVRTLHPHGRRTPDERRGRVGRRGPRSSQRGTTPYGST